MIPEIKKILYPTDLSENARYAFGFAVSLANHYDAQITVLHVVEEISSFARSMVREVMGENRWEDLIKKKETEIITNLKSRLAQFCNDVGQQQPDCPFVVDNTVVVTGHAVDQIVRYTAELDVDLVIMGSRGKGGLADVTMGSTSRRVLRRCKKPVLIVCPPENNDD